MRLETPQHIQMIFELIAELVMNATRDTVDPAMRAAAEGGHHGNIRGGNTSRQADRPTGRTKTWRQTIVCSRIRSASSFEIVVGYGAIMNIHMCLEASRQRSNTQS